ncbi:MAG: SAM hydrolase/SAM-dependent halogenase family protein [Thermodesulfobacteriota bacterium]
MNPPIVSLTTDFGDGPFVGVMKGVILGICPETRLVDLSHAVAPQDVLAGALALEQAIGFFPKNTVHLAVVDPGVGTVRRGLAIQALGQFWVGPDNGVFTPILRADPAARAFALTEPRYFLPKVSATFHGRDVFAPVAAHLANGLDPAALGPAVADPARLDWPLPRREGEALLGQVLAVDRFGNLMTNLDRSTVLAFLAGRPARIEAAGQAIAGVSPAYAAVAAGEALALFNSLDRLELAVNQGDLCRRLGLEPAAARGLAVRLLAISKTD